MQSGRGKVAGATVVWMALVVTAVAVAVVLLGGAAAWLAEHRMPGSTVRSWGDGLWWALTTLTTVGYGDHVPVTVAGRLVAAAVMITGVAVLGSVAAAIALVVARTVAATEERALEVEAESIEQRMEARFDDLDERLARIEEQLQRLASRTGDGAPPGSSRRRSRRECAVAPKTIRAAVRSRGASSTGSTSRNRASSGAPEVRE